ncbi:hypothetical protein Ocin01_17855 [Orchesella cincta]|uniref:Uncharacterized protein n=1 Tax=Orchesella cincta TaxID=48709 RepID=A0A1D2M777_ORCCI|nr:hypothetical protein Ocin01_17855 [Orchesella cincta]
MVIYFQLSHRIPINFLTQIKYRFKLRHHDVITSSSSTQEIPLHITELSHHYHHSRHRKSTQLPGGTWRNTRI